MSIRSFVGLLVGFCLWFGVQFALYADRDESLLFSVDFDDYSVDAGFAKGDPKCYSFENPDLQLRMFPGINDKGNAVVLTNEESCSYKLPGNFDPRQGTVSMWVSPQNWKVTDNKKWERFFTVSSPKFTMIVYKYLWPKCLMFYIKYPAAPGNKKTFTALTMLEEKDWPKGKWHKLDVTWNGKGMKLYVDGVMPAVYQEDSQLRIPFYKFQQPLNFPSPDELKKSFITFGMPKTARENKGTVLGDRTAFDELKIYNRPLSASEIRSGYEKHFPSNIVAKRQLPVITIPKTGKGITVDGEINALEWNDAGLVPVDGFLGDPIPGVSAKAYYKYDDKFLYIGIRANRACRMLKNHKDNDGNLWEEDSFEIMLQSSKKSIFHWIVNGNGAVYDEKDTDKRWNSGVKSAAVQGKNYWSAELAIPLKAFGAKLAGSEWRGNFGATYYTNTGRYSGWSKILYSYADPKSFGVIRFGESSAAVRLNRIGDLATGALDLSVELTPKSAESKVMVTAECMPDGSDPIKFPGQLAGKTWKTTLPVGKQMLRITGVMGKKKEVVFLYDKYAYVNFPLEIEYTCWSKRKYIEVDMDLNNSGSANLAAIADKGLSGVAKLIDSSGKARSERAFVVKKSNDETNLDLPSDLSMGDYWIQVEVTGVKKKLIRKILFKVPDMTPYKLKVADDHSIPSPWIPISVSADGKKIKVLDREYTFGNGPFPISAVSRGERLLSEPIAMSLGGSKVDWSGFKITEKYPDVVKLAGKGSAGDVSFSWSGELWFDGLYYLELTMNPKAKGSAVKIDSLEIKWSMPERFAKFVMTPLYEKWTDGKISLKPLPSTITAREHIMWLTGHVRGLMWWPESDANWVNKKNESPIRISRDSKKVDVSLGLITKTATLRKTATYKMAFMATPAKDQPENFRAFHADGFGRPKGQTAQHIGWGSFRNKFYGNGTTSPASHIPRDPVAYAKCVEGWRKKGIAPFTYAMPGQIRSKTAEYDYFRRTWATIPSHHHRLMKGGVRYQLQRCCGNTKVSDLFAYRTEQLFKKYPKLGGLYYDVGSSTFCQNTEHGHGGVDAFGKSYFSSGSMALRQLLMRIYKLHREYGKIFYYHSHSWFNPVCHTFIDYFYPGEQFYRLIAENYKYAYCEGMSLEQYQSELNGKIKGVGLLFLPQYGRAASGIQSIKHMKKEFSTKPEWAIRTITPLVLHDVDVTAAYIDREVTVPKFWKIKDDAKFADAEFFGYWTNPGVKSSSPKVLVSVYRWKKPSPYKVILAVSNMGREEQPIALSLDKKKLGLSGPVTYCELWDDKSLNVEELKTAKIKGNHFMLIGIK